MGIEGTYLNMISTISDKPTATAFSVLKTQRRLRSGQDKHAHPLSPFLFSIVLGVLAMAFREEK